MVKRVDKQSILKALGGIFLSLFITMVWGRFLLFLSLFVSSISRPVSFSVLIWNAHVKMRIMKGS